MYTKEDMVTLQARWVELKRLHKALIKEVIDLDSFFEEYNQAKDNIDQRTLHDLATYLSKVFDIIDRNTYVARPVYSKIQEKLSNKAILNEGAKVVKALNKGNPISSRAKKYRIAGIILTILGVALIAGIAVCAAPAIPALVAVLPALAVFTPLALKILYSAAVLYGAMNVATAFVDVRAFLFTLATPLLPLIGGIGSLMKAHELSKTPTGLALALANTLPALAEKTHYGDKEETNRARLKKVEGKLKAIQKLLKNGNHSDVDAEYLTEGKKYYNARIKYLQELAVHKAGTALPERPDKEALLIAKSVAGVSEVIIAAVPVNDHRDGVEGAKPRLSKSLVGTLFTDPKDYHVRHAQKVEAKAREAKMVVG